MTSRNRNRKSAKFGARDGPFRLKDFFFALLVVGGFFVGVEAVLWLAGFPPLPTNRDPFLGFSATRPLFVETQGPNGQPYLRTAPYKLAWFNDVSFPAAKPRGSFRIFSIGGSTTYGRPYTDPLSFSGWLRELLPLADPARKWEVINAGGISYASFRITVLMEELIRYKPDLFLVYMGHNEFLERRTYGNLVEAPRWLTTLGGWASRTRLYAAGEALLNRLNGPEKRPPLLGEEVSTILEHSVGPADYHRDDEQRRRVLAHFRYSLNRLIDLAESAGAGVILITPVSNLRQCSPFKSEPAGDLTPEQGARVAELKQQAAAKSDAADWSAAAGLLEQARSIDSRDADLQYSLGRALYKSGRYPEAEAAFRRARDEDICPLRAPTEIGKIIVETGKQRHVPVIDFRQTIRALEPHGLPGLAEFIDHVHLRAKGYGVLAEQIVAAMAQAGYLKISPAWNKVNLAAARERVRSRLDRQAYGESLLNVAKVYSWAGKLEESERFAKRARVFLRGDPELPTVLGHVALARGDYPEAIRLLRQALALEPRYPAAHFDLGTALYLEGDYAGAASEFEAVLAADPVTYSDAYNSLGLALHELGQFKRAAAQFETLLAAHPDHVDAHNNLGVTLLALGRYADAIAQFRAVLELTPASAEAHFNLGAAREAQGRHEDAVREFREAARLRPDYATAYNSLGLNLMLLGRASEALAPIEQAIRLDPGFAEAHDNLGSARRLTGNAAGAVEEFERAIDLRPDWAPPLLHLADLYTAFPDPAFHDPDRAVVLAERADALTNHQDPDVLDVLSAAHAAAGR